MSDIRSVIDIHVAAFNTRRPDDEPWSEDAELISPGGTFIGRDEVLGFLSVFQQAFSNGKLTIASCVLDDDTGRGSVEGFFDGVHDGPLHSPAGIVDPSGKTVSFRWSATYQVNDAQLMSEHLYFDQLDFLGQLGLT
ncbi:MULTISPECIES: ester cyclase [Gordonia]|uniref:ester cyclase n=1 Tax=Gordonia TaxID=2053 RepID=UPI00257E56EB|nr:MULTISPECIES: ester cyclase [Gordonia]